MSQQSENILLWKIARGDERAFLRLYDRYWEVLFMFVARIVKDSGEAEDIVQEVFIILWQKRTSLHQVRDIKAYLFTIAKNRSVKNLLKSKFQTDSLDTLIEFVDRNNYTFEQEYAAKELSESIDHEIDNLPEKMRDIFVLSRVEGLSNKEIAKSLNISEHTVKKQINNSLKRIRSNIRYFFFSFLF